MTSKRLAMVLATFAVTTSVAGTALASDTSADRTEGYAALLEVPPMDAMHLMDIDGKGYVTRHEFMKFHEQVFDRMDRDHDGKATAEEWVGGPAIRARHER